MKTRHPRRALGPVVLLGLALALASPASAQWSAQPGETKRNAFGPSKGDKVSMCRGACGLGCPDSCAASTVYECTGSGLLRRVETHECRTHRGCRQHDDCLDACTDSGLAFGDCQTSCHEEAVAEFGLENAMEWAGGSGPADGSPIRFEYTRAAPGEPDPAYRCPAGSRRQCLETAGRCASSSGAPVEPVFDSYPSAGTGAMSVSGFRAGRLCGERVCEESTEIRVTGEQSCDRGSGPAPCTRYGMEFDYRNADPSKPLECRTSTIGGKKDFIGDLIVKGLEAKPDLEGGPNGEDRHGMRVLLDVFKKVVTSADTPEDVQVSFAPFGPDGKPIESERIGTTPGSRPQSSPRVVQISAPSGHMVVPMFQVVAEADGSPLIREIRCSHNDVPVLETTFRLVF